jgi:hypothetical protein
VNDDGKMELGFLNRMGTKMQTRELVLYIVTLVTLNTSFAGPVSGQGDWERTLLPRDVNGDGVVDGFYDTTLNITWLANLNSSATTRTWAGAVSWASNLNVFGVTGWRLPVMTDPLAVCQAAYAGTNCGVNVLPSSSEMAHLFYVTLGNRSTVDAFGNPQTGGGFTNSGNFQYAPTVFQSYWYGTTYAPSPDNAWDLGLTTGEQTAQLKQSAYYAVAVHTGDIAPVPELSTAAMLFAGLTLFGAFMNTQRKRPYAPQ